MKKLILSLCFLLLPIVNYAAVPMPMQSLAPMLKKVMPGVVNVAVQGELPPLALPRSRSNRGDQEPQRKQRKFAGLGSGVIVNAEEGYIITNAHVVKDAKIITITLSDGRTLKAKNIGTDPSTDIAVLKIKADNLHTIPFGNSDKLQVGDFVVAIGNPFGLSYLGNKQTATFGIVSALQRSDLKLEGVENFIQTDAAINPGNSGGALVNMQGELLGINTGIVSPYRGNVGIGLAIPINMARDVMQQLIKYGSVHRGLMGIFVQQLTPELADAFGVPHKQGAIVTQVNPQSPAERAGIHAGDIIQNINGQVVNDATQVKNIVGLLRVGSKVNMEVLRDGKAMRINTSVADVKKHEENLLAQNPFLFGLALRNYDEQTPLHGRVQGVQIIGSVETSPGWRAGLRPGDVIISANRKSITNMGDLQKAASGQSQLLVHVLRGPGSMFLVVK